MPVSKQKEKELAIRRIATRILLQLGHSNPSAAKVLCIPKHTVSSDAHKLRKNLGLPYKPIPKTEQLVNSIYFLSSCRSTSRSSDYVESERIAIQQVVAALNAWQPIVRLRGFCDGIATGLRHIQLPTADNLPTPYRSLLVSLTGNRSWTESPFESYYVEVEGDIIWRYLLQSLPVEPRVKTITQIHKRITRLSEEEIGGQNFRRLISLPAPATEIICIIDNMLSLLAPREEEVIRLRYGIGKDRSYTLEEVGVVFSLRRERIRQIETKALMKLRHPSRCYELEKLLNTVGQVLDERDKLRLEVNRLTEINEAWKKAFAGDGRAQKLLAQSGPNFMWMQKDVDDLEFSVRTSNFLRLSRIKTIWELTHQTELDLLRTKNFGRKSLKEIKEILEEINQRYGTTLTLGMTDPPK